MYKVEAWCINQDQKQPDPRRQIMAKDITKLSTKELQELAAKQLKDQEMRKKHTDRRLAKVNVILRKAAAAKITASEAEIDAEMKRPKKGK